MELPPNGPNSGIRKIRYRVKAKNVSYKRSWQQNECYNWLLWKKSESSFILRNVHCEDRPGEITAIAGPSGAGKTTLLEILAGIIPLSRVFGEVLVNEQPMNARCFRRLSGYVTQDEALFPLLTVEETLVYSARLRLPGMLHVAAVRVKELVKELGLEHVAYTRIGSESRRGISGGEKRRVSIGIDLVHDPAVLLIDEPTSGLDSGFRILELFDQILLLSNGIVLHQGSLHLLEQTLRLTGHSIPRHVNVLEFAIEATDSLITYMEESAIEGREQDCQHTTTNPNYSSCKAIKLFYPNGRIKEVLILSQRFSNIIRRTNQLFVARILQALLAGVMLGTIFMNAFKDAAQHNLQTQLGFFAFTLTFLLSSTTEGLPIFLKERRILMKETSKGAYRVSSYVISNTLVFIPFLLMVALLYSTPVYWLVGLRRQMDGFLYFSLAVWMVVLMSNSFVACFSALVPNFIMGTSLIAGLMGSFFLFSGYFIVKDDIPKYWIFMHYLSLFKYPFECFMINEYDGEEGKRRCVQTVEGNCYLYGDGFLMQQGFDGSHKWRNLGVMLSFILGYRFLSFLILWYRSHRNRI